MRLLTFSNLYPNEIEPRHGIFVEQRLRRLVDAGGVEAQVVAPVPWFPFSATGFGRWAKFAKIPAAESRNGFDVHHPRYVTLPKVGMSMAPMLMALGARRTLRQLVSGGYDFDVIDAHYFYPDGVAAIILGRWLGKPVVITARGSDINVLPDFAIPRQWIKWAANECKAIISVSAALRSRMCELSLPQEKITVLRNGVDLDMFRPLARDAIRADLGVSGPLVLSVGNLVQAKGHDVVIKALASIPEACLIVIGDGPESGSLAHLAAKLEVSSRVRFINNLPQSELVRYYNAADVLALATEREGMPNVVLEAIACGTPVVASAVGGIPEILTADVAGHLIDDREVSTLADAIGQLINSGTDRAELRQHAENFSWTHVVDRQRKLYQAVAGSAN